MGSRILTESITDTRRMEVIGLRGAWLKVRKRNPSKKGGTSSKGPAQKLEVGSRRAVFSKCNDVA